MDTNEVESTKPVGLDSSSPRDNLYQLSSDHCLPCPVEGESESFNHLLCREKREGGMKAQCVWRIGVAY